MSFDCVSMTHVVEVTNGKNLCEILKCFPGAKVTVMASEVGEDAWRVEFEDLWCRKLFGSIPDVKCGE